MPDSRSPAAPIALLAGVPAIAAGFFWVVLLYIERERLYAHRPMGSNFLIVLTGTCVMAGLYDLYGSGKSRWAISDKAYLAVAALPPTFMIAAYTLNLVDASVPAFLRNPNWGGVLLFPGTMLAGVVLVRHGILPRWNWTPVLLGFVALPLDETIKASTGWRELGLAAAMTLGAAWIVLGLATRSMHPDRTVAA